MTRSSSASRPRRARLMVLGLSLIFFMPTQVETGALTVVRLMVGIRAVALARGARRTTPSPSGRLLRP